jgi:hypothetical protein
MPIIYSHECSSGPPEAAYYRVVADKEANDLCIQYFFFWKYQHCFMVPHKYDYEPIFLYLKRTEKYPYLIVNIGIGGPICRFTKIEIRSKSGKKDTFDVFFKTNLSPAPYYPFGKKGKVQYEGCSRKYPLERARDLQFKDTHHSSVSVHVQMSLVVLDMICKVRYLIHR